MVQCISIYHDFQGKMYKIRVTVYFLNYSVRERVSRYKHFFIFWRKYHITIGYFFFVFSSFWIFYNDFKQKFQILKLYTYFNISWIIVVCCLLIILCYMKSFCFKCRMVSRHGYSVTTSFLLFYYFIEIPRLSWIL